MPPGPVKRKLAAILAADIAGYSRLVGLDEEGTLERLKTLRQDVIDPEIDSRRGRIVKTTGDGLLIEFASVVDAVRCAVAVQRATATAEAATPAERRIEFRVGIHLGDVVVEDNDILGDGVNIAARLEGIAEAGGVCISASVYDQVRGKVEVEFTDGGDQSLKNIAQPVRVYRMIFGDRRTVVQPAAPPLPDKPSIAVLPFQNMSGDTEQEYFADGMVEEIITALSHIRWLFVIARNSTFAYKGQAINLKQVGRELGVRYILEGSVRKAGNRVRITAQLIEAETGTHLWADRFDGSSEDVFDLQDQVASSVAGVIEPALQAAETVRSAKRPTTDLTAYDLYLRASALFFASAQVPEALHLLEQAIARDPRYGLALAWAAICCYRMLQDGRSKNPQEDRRKGLEFARRAVEVAGDDAAVLANAADALSFFGEDVGAVIALVDRALALNPNYARGWHVSGVVRLRAGQPDLAIQHGEIALRLSPRVRVGSTFYMMGFAHFIAGRFDEAAAKFPLAIQENPTFAEPYRALAASYAHMGRLDDARDVIARLRAVTSQVMPDPHDLRYLPQRESLISGLRLAMCDPE
jgi:adenylate cyclase